MRELPKGWAETTLAQLVVPDRPRDLPRDYPHLPFVGMEHVEAHSMRLLGTVPASGLKSSAVHFQTGDVLYGRLRPYLNKVLVAGFEGLCSAEFIVFARRAHLNSAWLAYFLNSSLFVSFSSHLNAGDRPRVDFEQIGTYELLVAPRKEQDRIVDEIEKQFTRLDAATTALKRVQDNLKRYRASVLKAACEGRLVSTEAELARQEGRGYEPADKLLQRILRERRARWEADTLAKMQASGKPPKDDHWKQKYKEPSAPNTTNLSPLPEGWCWARAEQLCGFITKGTTPSANKLFDASGDVPFIKVYNLTFTGRLDFDTNPTYVERQTHEQELSRSRVIPGDVLMNIVGPPLGKVSVVPDLHEEWNVNQAIAIFRPIEGVERSYLAGLLMTEQILRWATQRAKATAGQFNLTLEICRDLPLPLPPANEQKRIAAELDRQITNLDRTSLLVDSSFDRARNARQAILSAAFTGQLVPQDPTDEPASILLERIRSERVNQSQHTAARNTKQKPKTARQ
jgi:type I restriction enzyme S subunit